MSDLNPNQLRILRTAAEPSGPLLANGEIALSSREDRDDARRLTRLGLMRGPIARGPSGQAWALTAKGRRAVVG